MKQNLVLSNLEINNNSNTLLERAKKLNANGCGGFIICEEYTDDKTHEENLHAIKTLCASISVPVYAKVKSSLEDVKKYLYAGCEGIIIDENDEKLINEACSRFTAKGIENKSLSTDISFSELKTDDKGLIPCIVQDFKDGTVLMMAYMNEQSFNETLKTGKMTYFSRSRNKLWLKGEESGHFQFVKSLTTDCDKDALLAKVDQVGVACHTGSRSCFFNDIIGHNDFSEGNNGGGVLNEVYEIILDRKDNPKEGSYTNYLFDKGIDKILKKVGEEATEIIIAAKNPEKEEIIYEISDFLYHVSVLMALKGVSWDKIMEELKNR